MTPIDSSKNNQFIDDFKKRSDVHLARKVWHMSGVTFFFLVWSLLPVWLSLTLLLVAWVAFVPLDLVRLYNPKINRVLLRWFKPIMRKNEIDRPAGTTYLITGVITVGFLSHPQIVGLSLLFLAFADPIASYVGIRYGKDKIFGHKSVQGFIAAFIVCFLLTVSFLYYHNVGEYILIVSLLSGLVGALAELIPIAKIDDNFTMPVLSCIGLTTVFGFFNIFQYLGYSI